MTLFLKFCRKYYHAGFVWFILGGGIEVLSPCLPAAPNFWISLLGLFIMAFSAVILAVGLIVGGRQPERSNKSDASSPEAEKE